MSTPVGPVPPMTDYVKLIGPASEWTKQIREGHVSREKRDAAKHLPAPRHGQTPEGHSWLAHKGAAELLGCPGKQFTPQDLRTCIEATFDYWHGKMFTLRSQPFATTQCFQDEFEFNIANIPSQPGSNLPPNDASFRNTNAILRPLTYNFTLYTYATEIKDALDRLDALDLQTKQSGSDVVTREIEWIRELAGQMVEETKLAMRLFWASGPGWDLVRLSLCQPWQTSTNISKDIRLHLVKPLRELEIEKPYDAAFAALCLNVDEKDADYGPSDFTRLLAFEQAAENEKEIKMKYPYALQMALGEWTMALELLSELPPPPDRLPEMRRPKTCAVRLNVSKSAATQICTAQPFVNLLCNRNSAPGQCQQLWESIREIQGIFAAEFGLPLDLREKLFPFMENKEEVPRWEPRNEWGTPLSGATPSFSGETIGAGKRKRTGFTVNQKDRQVWEQMMTHDPNAKVPASEVFRIFRSLGFVVESLGGSFMRFAPPQNAGTPWIMRIPAFDTWAGPGPFEVPLAEIGYNMRTSSCLGGGFGTPIADD